MRKLVSYVHIALFEHSGVLTWVVYGRMSPIRAFWNVIGVVYVLISLIIVFGSDIMVI